MLWQRFQLVVPQVNQHQLAVVFESIFFHFCDVVIAQAKPSE